MGINEAKVQIAKEFISEYAEWMNDHNNADMTDSEYGRKYGMLKDNDSDLAAESALGSRSFSDVFPC